MPRTEGERPRYELVGTLNEGTGDEVRERVRRFRTDVDERTGVDG